MKNLRQQAHSKITAQVEAAAEKFGQNADAVPYGRGRPQVVAPTDIRKQRTFSLSDKEMGLFKDIKAELAKVGVFDANNSAIIRAALENLRQTTPQSIAEYLSKVK